MDLPVPTQLPASLNFLIPHLCELERVGSQRDGGYIIPSRVVHDTGNLFSIGIATDWSFEQALSRCNKRMQIFAFDRSSGSLVFLYLGIRGLLGGRWRGRSRIELVRQLRQAWQWLILGVRFKWYFRGRRHFTRRWVKQVASSRKEVSLSAAMAMVPKIGSIIVKIDIEGDEYNLSEEICNALVDRQNQISAVCMEFHETERYRAEFVQIVSMIGELFPIAHLHGNNYCPTGSDGLPTVLEVTFVRRDLVQNSNVFIFPRPGLDYPNNPDVPDLAFEFRRPAAA